jgi:hypothetical protein
VKTDFEFNDALSHTEKEKPQNLGDENTGQGEVQYPGA